MFSYCSEGNTGGNVTNPSVVYRFFNNISGVTIAISAFGFSINEGVNTELKQHS